MWYRYPDMLALLILLTTSQRDILAWRALPPVMPTHQRSLRYQYPQLPHIATLRAGRQVQGWVCHCVCLHPLWTFIFSPSLVCFLLKCTHTGGHYPVWHAKAQLAPNVDPQWPGLTLLVSRTCFFCVLMSSHCHAALAQFHIIKKFKRSAF